MSNPVNARKRTDERDLRRNLQRLSGLCRLGCDITCRRLSQLWRAIVAKFIPVKV